MILTRREIVLTGMAAIAGAGGGLAVSQGAFVAERPSEKRVRREFLDGEVVMVDGLVLSCSEYAWLACHGDVSSGDALVEALDSLGY